MYWASDYGIFLVDMYHASKLEQTVGISSRFGWAHPGPINYYLLLPWYYLSGGGEQILMAATLAYNVFFLTATVFVITRLSNSQTAGIFISVAVIYSYSALGAGVFYDVLLPLATIFPWILAISLACFVALNGIKYFLLLGLVLTYVAQMHVAFWLPVVSLGLSAFVLSCIERKPSHSDYIYAAAGIVFCIVLWLPPLLEFENLQRIISFFLSRGPGEHTLIEAVRALAVLMGEPVLGNKLFYENLPSENYSMIAGGVLIFLAFLGLWLAYLKKYKFALILSFIVCLQLITYLYALTKVVGPILPHSITFIPIISVFILLAWTLLIQGALDSKLRLLAISTFATMAILFFIHGSSHDIGHTLLTYKTPNSAVLKLSKEISSAIHKCEGPATILMGENDWLPIVGALSVLYRDGLKFGINPAQWAIVFGWRVPTSISDCRISFGAGANGLEVEVTDYGNKALYTIRNVYAASDFKFDRYGEGNIDTERRSVHSESFTDSGLASQEINLPSGLYRIAATLSWKSEPGKDQANSGHISIHSKRVLFPIMTPQGSNESVVTYYVSDGTPFRISFGLGGWSTGRGFVTLDDLHIDSVQKALSPPDPSRS
jgi:hypothetical protein